MKKVIQHKSKMKKTLFLVFGVYSLVLFCITSFNPSYASEGIVLDSVIESIVGVEEEQEIEPAVNNVVVYQDEEDEQEGDAEDDDNDSFGAEISGDTEEDTQDSQPDEGTSLDAQDDEGDAEDDDSVSSRADSEGNGEEGEGSSNDSEISMDSQQLYTDIGAEGTSLDAQNDEGDINNPSVTDVTAPLESGAQDEDIEEQKVNYNKYGLAVLAQKLGIDWENDSEKWAVLAGVEGEYYGTAQQNEKIRVFLVENADKILDGSMSYSNDEGKTQDSSSQAPQNDDNESSRAEGEGSGNDGETSMDSQQAYTDIGAGQAHPAEQASVEFTPPSGASEGQVDAENDNMLSLDKGDTFTTPSVGEAEGIGNKAQELENAWKTLNSQQIAKSYEHNKVRVNVKAPIGSFPEGTKLVIKPIDKGNENKVAFDISFIYTYSDGSEVELQPKEGSKVQVTFNYENNAEWLDQINNGGELKVTHTHAGNKENVKVMDKGEGSLTLDMDKFSEFEVELVKGGTENTKDIIIQATSTEANQTLKINKYFSNDYTVDRGDGNSGNMTSDTGHTYTSAGTYNIILSTTANRWTFQNGSKPLVATNGTSMTGVKIVYMPSLADGFGDSATAPGNNFFVFFNLGGALTSLPEGSFDTSNITTVGGSFFSSFNEGGSLTSLPSGSFDTSNITTAGIYFFNSFNRNGALTSLPEGSFDTSNITTVGGLFFSSFNNGGALTSLPEGSFRFSTGLTTVGDYFFYFFNRDGALTSLPEGSFDTSNITTAGIYFFNSFNNGGALTSLPEGSFKFSTGLTTVKSCFFCDFNYGGALISLPEGSFDTSNITTVGGQFFSSFNSNGALTSLPEGSFRFSTGLTTVGDYFFYFFNAGGALTSLPEGSFDTSNITTVGGLFFSNFNARGALTSLPEGSFNMSNITIANDPNYGERFFDKFNYFGALKELPTSFTMNSVLASKGGGYSEASLPTKNVYDLVVGITPPSSDRNTFSDNQPGRCGVHENWLQTTVNACSITYDSNGGSTITNRTKNYTANTTGVVAGSGISVPTRDGYILSGWTNQSGQVVETVIFPDMDGDILYAHWEASKDIIIQATATAANQTLKINKYFANAYTVDRGDGSAIENLTVDTTHTYATAGTYNIILSLSGASRWTFQEEYHPLVPISGTTMTGVKITYMPSLSEGFGSSAVAPGDYFFAYFNYNGKLTSLPEGSFDTSNITTVGHWFFSYFNGGYDAGGSLTGLPEGSFDTSNITMVGKAFFGGFNSNGLLTSLPEGSFDTSAITTAGNSFFSEFNGNGAITSLPVGSFDTSAITTAGENFFYKFNYYGAITSLPEGSFDISHITIANDSFFYGFNLIGAITSLPEGSFDISNITTVGHWFFSYFNAGGKLTSLPEGSFRLSPSLTTVKNAFFSDFNSNGAITSLPDGSFDTSAITTAGTSFFYNFNNQGALTSLPEGSFDTSAITTVGESFFSNFNSNGKLTNLPEGSFDTSAVTTARYFFFQSFNNGGALTSLPEGSFDTSKITTAGDFFFSAFNSGGAITSLPVGSFDTSKITTVGSDSFSYFNSNGAITSLPEGSFDTSKITTVGYRFFSNFNYYGKIINLPNSFKLNSDAYKGGYEKAFNSYTFNRKVSDLVEGITPPSSDRNVFSDNQPGRCGVDPNWLVNTSDACKITYNANGGNETTTGSYAADATSVVAGSNITVPTRVGYSFDGWYTDAEGGNKIETVTFPDMDGDTLYAHWEGWPTVTFDANGGSSTPSSQTVEKNAFFTVVNDGDSLNDHSGKLVNFHPALK